MSHVLQVRKPTDRDLAAESRSNRRPYVRAVIRSDEHEHRLKTEMSQHYAFQSPSCCWYLVRRWFLYVFATIDTRTERRRGATKLPTSLLQQESVM